MKSNRPVFLALILTSMNLSAADSEITEQQPIIVTATKTAQTADETIAPVIVIERSEIERNPNAAISDLLRMHAGIDVGRSGGPGQQTSIFIRGAESNHTLVMIDGVKINPGTIGTAAIQNIDLNMIERIEIVKGPRSTLYGSDAIGGVINIITREGKEGSQYNIKAGYGSFNTRSLGVSAHNKMGDRAAGIDINIKKTDGYEIRTTSPLKRGYDNVSVHLYGKKRIGETDVQVSHWQSNGKTEYLDFFLTPLDQDYENSATAVDVENNITETWFSKIKFSHALDKIDQNQSVDFVHTVRDTIDWQNDIQISDDQLLTSGIYLSNENTNASVFGSKFNEDTLTKAIFIQDDILIKSHHIIAGIRHTSHEYFGDHNTGSFDYSWQLSKPVKLFVGVATGFRSPDSTDRFGFAGNPDLLPEESENKELGIQYTINKQQNMRVNYFDNKITNLIEYDLATNKMLNIDSVQISGTEIEYQYKNKSWSVNASAIFQKPENTATGEILSRRSENTYTLAINHYKDSYNIGLDVLYTGERDDSAYNSIVLKSYSLINMNATYQMSKHLSINGRIENLTDEEYELAATYRTPERSYYLELVYNFD